ncbi:fibronectin type III domain-containing protein [Chryseobacterium indoltheticum]|uniref:fibronectin type III domain-containing protein n=1 Tax=Chryseobacterium indoltheticum TaxID=254 RepID=UPI003F494659
MRKILLTCMMALATMSSAQISYSYGWEPTGDGSWTSGGDSGWYSRSETTPCTGIGSMRANNYYNSSSYLISPVLTGTNGGDLNVSFAYKVTEYADNDTGASLADFGVIKLDWATSENGPWTTAYTIDNTNHIVSASCATKSATISGVPSSGNLFIRLEAKSALDTSDNYVYFDDINITQGAAPSCLDPSSVTSSNVTSATADISWTAPTLVPGNGYELYYNTNGIPPTATTTPVYTNVVGTSKALSGLSPGLQYYVWVRSSLYNDLKKCVVCSEYF